MKRMTLLLAMIMLSGAANAAVDGPVTLHCKFESMDIIEEDWVEKTGLKTVEERKWSLVDGRFGRGLHLGAVPLSFPLPSGLGSSVGTSGLFDSSTKALPATPWWGGVVGLAPWP